MYLPERYSVDEIGVREGGERAGCFGEGFHHAADDEAVDGGPALSVVFVARLAPAAVVDGGPAGDEVEGPFDEVNPDVGVAEEIVPRDGEPP